MFTDLEINIATKEDIDTIHNLAVKIWNAHYPSIISQQQIDFMLTEMYSVESLHEQMENNHVFLLAMMDNVACGYLSYNAVTDGNYFLNKLYVDVSLQGKNIGKMLLDRCLTKCAPLHTMRLQVNRKNYKAINFYFKNGFSIEEVKDFDIGNNFFMNDFIMLKKF
jgi:ribosomal protein S18 acetylase RimI-like enzyme